MILIDTSVLIDYLRTKDPKLSSLLTTLPVTLAGVIRAEVLRGAKNPAEFASLLTILNGFPTITMPDPLWDEIGRCRSTLRTHGITVPFQDVVIAMIGLHYTIEIWTRDKQFQLIQGVLSQLRLFQEPP